MLEQILVTPEPKNYRLICTVARRYARNEVEAQLRAEGRRLSRAICVPCYSVVRRRQSAQSSLSRPLGRQPSLGRAFDELHLLGLRSLAVVRARQSGPPDR